MQPLILEHSSIVSNMMGGSDWHFGVWVGMWNVGCLSGKGEVCEELRKRVNDVLFVRGEMERTGC